MHAALCTLRLLCMPSMPSVLRVLWVCFGTWRNVPRALARLPAAGRGLRRSFCAGLASVECGPRPRDSPAHRCRGIHLLRLEARSWGGPDVPARAAPRRVVLRCRRGQKFDVPVALEGLPEMKPEDQQYFGKLLKVRKAFC